MARLRRIDRLFEAALDRRRIDFARLSYGHYAMTVGAVEIAVNLETLDRSADRKTDSETVERFVTELVTATAHD